MIDKAIQKINEEMQKNPTDPYTEIIGHYIIDRCADEFTAAKVAAEGKTLEGAMNAIMEAAKKAKKGNVAVLLPAVVFGEVDKYFGIAADPAAQMAAVAPGGGAPAQPAAPAPAAKKISLDLSSFL